MIEALTEVVGGSGRIGSQFMRLTKNAIGVPRGVCPGSISKDGTPIYVCTPASAWSTVYETTFPRNRCSDLVFIGNGLLADTIPVDDITVVVPHYAILKRGESPSSLSDSAPPTYIAGKHSETVEGLLRSDGLSHVQRCHDVREIWVHMVQKLLWSSCLWLLCHTLHSDGPPMSVSEVHEQHAAQLQALVLELWPSVRAVMAQRVSPTINELPTMEESIRYLEQYSFSIPNAVPSLQLAQAEMEYRNQVFTTNRHPEEQPMHFALLSQVLGAATARSLFEPTHGTIDATMDRYRIMDLRTSIGMAVYGQRQAEDISETECNGRPRHILIVGAGILGSSVAYHLAKEMRDDPEKSIHSVTVMDATCANVFDLGLATKASFGWINANFEKQPSSYQQLNVLGMHAWRHNRWLCAFPEWNGSIVRVPKTTLDALDFSSCQGYYTCLDGPITESQLQRLEPELNFAKGNHAGVGDDFYVYPNDGSVDPAHAALWMHSEAEKLGVKFVWRHKVQRILQSNEGTIEGVEYTTSGETDGIDVKTLHVSDIVVAAGIGSADAELGGLPLQSNATIAGRLALYKSTEDVKFPRQIVRRVIVDMVHQYHMLQRSDETIVVGGGGNLQVGGTNSTLAEGQDETSMLNDTNQINDSGVVLPLPSDVQQVGTRQADRPIPLDGFPCVGYFPEGPPSQGNVYSLVSHSGITLAPLLGALAATEILHRDLSLDVLSLYRPTRFGVGRSRKNETSE